MYLKLFPATENAVVGHICPTGLEFDKCTLYHMPVSAAIFFLLFSKKKKRFTVFDPVVEAEVTENDSTASSHNSRSEQRSVRLFVSPALSVTARPATLQ